MMPARIPALQLDIKKLLTLPPACLACLVRADGKPMSKREISALVRMLNEAGCEVLAVGQRLDHQSAPPLVSGELAKKFLESEHLV